jgi:spore germination protein YaaH
VDLFDEIHHKFKDVYMIKYMEYSGAVAGGAGGACPPIVETRRKIDNVVGIIPA